MNRCPGFRIACARHRRFVGWADFGKGLKTSHGKPSVTEQILRQRLSDLRAAMARHGVAAMIVPRSDAHQSEYVAACDERLAYVSGFTGSAGFAVVTPDAAALFTDGRYTIQARNQLIAPEWQLCNSSPDQPLAWIGRQVARGARVGFDPRLHRHGDIETLRAALSAPGLELVAMCPNPVDEVWQDRPAPPLGQVWLYPDTLAGETREAKLARVAAGVAKDGCAALLVSSPENLAWVLNLRGQDIEMVPVSFGYALIKNDGSATLFMDPAKISPEVALGLCAGGKVALAPPDALTFAGLSGQTLRCDAASASVAMVAAANAAGVRVDVGQDPIYAFKACKNEIEAEGMRAANLRDGVALVQFLRWFDQDRPADASEWDAAQVIARARAALDQYRGPSFGTIAAAGESAAQAHYKTAPETARLIATGDIFLLDSGGHYLDGTTDVTRVCVAGTPTPEMRARYTQVLRGHVAVMRQRFPEGVDGAQLDTLARAPLWQQGVDFEHGTGHGVGHFLSVHEGPQSISSRGRGVPLRPGMVVSVEPGYYKAGQFGIRIENLALVRHVYPRPAEAERPLLEFECLTFAPYARDLIDIAQLSPDELDWVDAYHAQVRDKLAPLLDGPDLAYLRDTTRPLRA